MEVWGGKQHQLLVSPQVTSSTLLQIKGGTHMGQAGRVFFFKEGGNGVFAHTICLWSTNRQNVIQDFLTQKFPPCDFAWVMFVPLCRRCVWMVREECECGWCVWMVFLHAPSLSPSLDMPPKRKRSMSDGKPPASPRAHSLTVDTHNVSFDRLFPTGNFAVFCRQVRRRARLISH